MAFAALGGSLVRARTIARTETLRAYREAGRESYAANADVVSAWRWTARHSGRTCAACLALDGRVFDTRERMGTHPNCSCVMVPVTKTWAELGLEGVPETRPAAPPDGEAWLRGQPAAVQRQVLGDVKWRAWKAGEIALADLVGERRDARWGVVRWERSLKDAREGVAARPVQEIRSASAKRLLVSDSLPSQGPNQSVPLPRWEEKLLLSSLPRAERRIARATAGETIVVFGPDGKGLFARRTSGRRYRYSAEELLQLNGATITHNHPGGGSFSIHDIRTACIGKVAEMRAVSQHFFYSVKPPPAGWDEDYWVSILEPTIRALEHDALKGVGKETVEEYMRDYFHDLWTALDAQSKIVYTRERR